MSRKEELKDIIAIAQRMISAPSCYAGLKEVTAAWIDSIGTDKEKKQPRTSSRNSKLILQLLMILLPLLIPTTLRRFLAKRVSRTSLPMLMSSKSPAQNIVTALPVQPVLRFSKTKKRFF